MRPLRATTFVTTMTLAATLVGCGHTDNPGGGPPPPSAAVVLSVHQNAPKIPAQQVMDALPPVTNGSRLIAVGVDGTVDGVDIYDATISAAGAKLDRRNAVSSARIAFGKALDAAGAGAAESDPLGAIAVAARRLHDGAGDKTLIIADSLLPTAGQLQFQRTGFAWTTEDLWEVLSAPKPNNLPDLHGIHVKVIGLGETTSPQQPLDEAKTKQLEDLWRKILTGSGAKDPEFVHAGVGDEASKSKYKVSVVPIRVPVPPGHRPKRCAEQVVPQTIVQFKPDVAEFLDRPTAQAAADGVAKALAGCEGRLTVTGTTSSWGSETGRLEVSNDRALAFRDLLAGVLGVPAEAIAARGVGTHFCGFVDDRTAAGVLIPERATLNRTVRVGTTPTPAVCPRRGRDHHRPVGPIPD
ncbi:OmpA family protein [Kribbella sp. NPDC026611]|uniref:OmpA family protein n=1 Tax=Kribbella sp. NPDC026611 TaxID=3154911 RepID=UPI0033E64719